MKRGFFITSALTAAVMVLLIFALPTQNANAAEAVAVESSCPEITVTGIQGCVGTGVFGCLEISTINGRSFALEGNTSGISVGDQVSVSGNIVPDSDCGCAIVVTSSSVIGSC